MADHVHTTDTAKIRMAFFINLTFTVVELIGGLYTNSVAILSDALHDLGDSLSLGLAWYFQKVAHKGRDHQFTYGYRRFSLLGAIVNSLVLVVGSVIIAVKAIPRLFDPQMPDATGMIWLAIGGILANGFAAWRLHGGESINARAVYLHLLEDVLGWVATLLAAVVMHFQMWPVLDPLLAVLISVFILFGVFKNLKKSMQVILQGTPENIDPERIREKLKALNGVLDTHDCHIWSMDGQYHILSIHLMVNDNHTLQSLTEIKTQAKALLRAEHIRHATIEFEGQAENCTGC